MRQQYVTGEIAHIPTIAHALDGETPIAAMPNDEAFEYYDRTSSWSGSRPIITSSFTTRTPTSAMRQPMRSTGSISTSSRERARRAGRAGVQPGLLVDARNWPALLVGGWKQMLEPLRATQHLIANHVVTTDGEYWVVGGRYDIWARRNATGGGSRASWT